MDSKKALVLIETDQKKQLLGHEKEGQLFYNFTLQKYFLKKNDSPNTDARERREQEQNGFVGKGEQEPCALRI